MVKTSKNLTFHLQPHSFPFSAILSKVRSPNWRVQKPMSPTSSLFFLSSQLMNGALRVDFNYCSVAVGIGHALNWNETHFFPSAGEGGEWRVKGETGYCILIEPSSGWKFSHNYARQTKIRRHTIWKTASELKLNKRVSLGEIMVSRRLGRLCQEPGLSLCNDWFYYWRPGKFTCAYVKAMQSNRGLSAWLAQAYVSKKNLSLSMISN